ncbi:MAG TPA: hypothetical protein VF064_12595 [Pyrinomonadaceae bacterium]
MFDDYKEAHAAADDLKAGEVRGVEPAIRFLKADVNEFGAGYAKEDLWRYLSRVPLTGRQKERLLQVARQYLGRRMTREFWQMCRFVGRIADEGFAACVEDLNGASKDEGVRQRASLLAAYLRGPGEGEKERRRFTRRVRYGKVEVTTDEA